MAAVELASRIFASLPELIAENAAVHPEKRAMVQDGVTVTYGELHALTGRIAASLLRMGVGPRSAVAIVSASTIPAALAFLGALRAGCVAAPIPPSASPKQIESMITDCGASVVFIDADAEAMLTLGAATAVRLEALTDWMVTSEVEPPAIEITPTDAFNIIYSSGTTGTPKGIVHTHAMRWTQIAGFATAGLGGAVMMVATPLYSNGTLISFLPTLAFGGTVLLMSKFDARKFLQIAERERATHVMLVPVQIQRIMALPDFDNFDLSHFQFKACGSAPFSAALKADVLRRWPGALMEMYGLTEGGGTCLLMAHEFPNKLHTVGRPAPGHDIRLIDEQGREVAQGGIGEVVGNSGAMMSGYHGRSEASSAAVWTDAQGKSFIRHGDIGRFDEDGFLILLGRTKDMIISGGFNVYPPDIEAVLMQHPAVAECAVIGVPSEAWGETPYAYYAPKTPGVSASDIMEWVNSRVGKTQRLSGAEPIDALPYSAIGKVLKRELCDQFLAARKARLSSLEINTMKLQGRVAIVTGAGGGLGRTHAHLLARYGAKVVVNDLGPAALRVAEEIVAAGGEAVAFQASVTDEAQINAMVGETVERWGRIDILINNAGILRDKSFAKMTVEDFRLVVEVHLMGSMICSKAVWDMMRRQNYGRIVMTTSSSGLFGNFGQSNYGAAKMGVVGLMQTLAIEGLKNNILVNCLAPTAATGMSEGLMTGQVKRVLKAEAVSPGLLSLVWDGAPTRAILCAGAGQFERAYITMSAGQFIGTPEDAADQVVAQWDAISDRAGDSVPVTGQAQAEQELIAAFRTPQTQL